MRRALWCLVGSWAQLVPDNVSETWRARGGELCGRGHAKLTEIDGNEVKFGAFSGVFRRFEVVSEAFRMRRGTLRLNETLQIRLCNCAATSSCSPGGSR